MNPKNILNQIAVAVNTIVQMIDKLDEIDLQNRPTANKYSVGELLSHIALICEADWRISNEATQSEMEIFYLEVSYESLLSIKEGLLTNFKKLQNNYANLSVEELMEKSTSYWGVTYTRFEWLLEIMAHIYHHRGQLHAILVHCLNKDPKINMFE